MPLPTPAPCASAGLQQASGAAPGRGALGTWHSNTYVLMPVHAVAPVGFMAKTSTLPPVHAAEAKGGSLLARVMGAVLRPSLLLGVHQQACTALCCFAATPEGCSATLRAELPQQAMRALQDFSAAKDYSRLQGLLQVLPSFFSFCLCVSWLLDGQLPLRNGSAPKRPQWPHNCTFLRQGFYPLPAGAGAGGRGGTGRGWQGAPAGNRTFGLLAGAAAGAVAAPQPQHSGAGSGGASQRCSFA